MNLGELFTKYGSDKTKSGYHNVYEQLFAANRWQYRLLLEVGIGTLIPHAPSSMHGCALPHYKPGGSLRAWAEYMPHADIVGLDVQPDTQFQEERIRTFLCNSTDAPSVSLVMDQLDAAPCIIIDDGCHKPDSQLATAALLWPYVREGGFYIIEDCMELHYNPPQRARLEAFFRGSPFVVTESRHLTVVMKREE